MIEQFLHRYFKFRPNASVCRCGLSLILIPLIGCASLESFGRASEGEITPLARASFPAQISDDSPALERPAKPSSIAVILDKTASVETLTPWMPSANSFRPVLEAHVHTGGELAVGGVCTDSTLPLQRNRIDEPPLLDKSLLVPLTPPKPPNADINPLEKRKHSELYQEDLAEYEAGHANNQNVLTQHEKTVEAHASDARIQNEAFLEGLAPFLNKPANCQSSDVNGALARAVTYLNEPPSWRSEPQRFLIFVTDGVDTQGNPSVDVSGIHVLLVNGGLPDKGVFADIEHQPFESIEAALRFVVSHTGN